MNDTIRDATDDSGDRRSRILGGARAAFMRFGFERASMADIAAGAGVTRTALYHYFPGKEDVLQAVVDEFHASNLAAAAKALENSRTLGDALLGLFDAKFGQIIALMVASPHALELVDASHRLTGPATRAADDAFQAIIVTALKRHGRKKEAIAVADTLIAAAKGLVPSAEVASPKKAFDARLRRLVSWVTG